MIGCRSCRFWLPVPGFLGPVEGRPGECRAAPPMPLVTDQGRGSIFPIVSGNEWCGRWEAGGSPLAPKVEDPPRS